MVLLMLLVASAGVRGQVTNLAGLDKKVVHWGIQIGYTQSKFDFDFTEDDEVRQAIQGTTSYYNPGFHVAVVGDLRLNNYLNVRMVPGLTLINRSMSYSWSDTYAQTHHNLDERHTVESAYGEIPIDLKFRAFRWRNMRPYLTGGMSYGFDFASLRKNRNNSNMSIVRLNAHDFRYTYGVGFDFYLRYVKFAIEMKMSFGLNDLMVPDDDLYTLSTNGLHSRTFMLGFTFEG